MYLLCSLHFSILVPYLRWRDLVEVDMNQGAQEAGRRIMDASAAIGAIEDEDIKKTTFKTTCDRHPPNASTTVIIPMTMATLEVFYLEDDVVAEQKNSVGRRVLGIVVLGGGGKKISDDDSGDGDNNNKFYYSDTGDIVSWGMNPKPC